MYDRDLLKELMTKPMTRKEFLRNLGLLFLSMFGASALLGLILKQPSATTKKSIEGSRSERGYGGSGYGL